MSPWRGSDQALAAPAPRGLVQDEAKVALGALVLAMGAQVSTDSESAETVAATQDQGVVVQVVQEKVQWGLWLGREVCSDD